MVPPEDDATTEKEKPEENPEVENLEKVEPVTEADEKVPEVKVDESSKLESAHVPTEDEENSQKTEDKEASSEPEEKSSSWNFFSSAPKASDFKDDSEKSEEPVGSANVPKEEEENVAPAEAEAENTENVEEPKNEEKSGFLASIFGSSKVEPETEEKLETEEPLESTEPSTVQPLVVEPPEVIEAVPNAGDFSSSEVSSDVSSESDVIASKEPAPITP